MMRSRVPAVALAIALAFTAAGCTDPNPDPSLEASPSAPASGASGSPTPEPSPSPWELALAEAAALPLDEAAGSVIMQAVSTPDPEAAADLVATHHLGGVIVMGDAVTDEASVEALTAAIAGADPMRPWPVLIATDQEGGLVQRLRPVLGYVSAFMAAGANGDAAQIRAYYSGLGAEMAGLGFTMDLAPVADVTVGVGDPTIRTRSAGSRPDAVAEVVGEAWQGLAEGGVVPVIKHFPGHGSVETDSHLGLPVQDAPVAELATADFVPFEAAISAGVPAVMLGHIAVPEWGKAPATVNADAYAYLRETLGFEGLAVTDAMNMEAITDRYSAGEAAVAAVRAGADLVVMPASTSGAVNGIVSAVKRGTLARERLDEAVARIILVARTHASGVETGVAAERPSDFVEGSVVVAAKNCDALIGEKVAISGGSSAQRKALASALRDRGVTVSDSGTSILLVEGDRGRGSADVVVAMGGPWGLPRSTAQAYVATWGSGRDQLDALAAVLSGEVTPRGTWPVKVTLPYEVCG
jgi:beta-N-acetylhexosaminidase